MGVIVQAIAFGPIRRRWPDVAAAICWRWADGELELCLVTTRDGARWTFPKGHREPGEALWRTAGREALEEAGVTGPVDRRRLVTYRNAKRRPVAAFLLRVQDVGTPVEGFRDRAWFDVETTGRRLAENRGAFHAGELARAVEAARVALTRVQVGG